jgi:S-adenosylmethionine synthetase
MIRFSEMVLPGHPDKFCDQVADAIVAFDRQAYCQVEVGVWCDQIWISGGFTVGTGGQRDLNAIVQDVVARVGYRTSTGALRQFQIMDVACRHEADPQTWTRQVNDQAICVGWAGYDPLTRFHAPEHFLAHTFREALWNAIQAGPLKGQGSDGKLLVVMAEEGSEWRLEQVLVTLEQESSLDFLLFTGIVEQVMSQAYEEVRRRDPRWRSAWGDVNLILNPNGPLLEAGPEGDNGQTGRKLVMDYYGPRIGIGGGALSGKHLTHIDRIGAYAARRAAIRAVKSGARDCRIQLAYAPNCPEPMEITYEMDGRGTREPKSFFDHQTQWEWAEGLPLNASWGQGLHFWREGEIL